MRRKIYAPDCASVGARGRVNLPKSVVVELLPNAESARVGAAADDAEAFRPCGNECSYARLIFSSHISHFGESPAAGRLLD
jgi:hypothetical protein